MALRIKILISILLLSFCAKAQNPFPYGSTRQITFFQGGIWIDSLINLPVRDTIDWTPLNFRKLGRLTVRPQDNLAYFNTGTKWVYAFGKSGGNTSIDISDVNGLQTILDSKISIVNFKISEHPSGVTNGSNTTFNITYTPISGTVELKWNGVVMSEGVGNDYTILGNTITTIFVASTGDELSVNYLKQ